jgi:PAS domain S-box-containing protein
LAWGPVLQAHPLAHFVYDTGTLALLAANEAALERYGYTREAFLKLNRADLLVPSEVPTLRRFLAGLPDSALAERQPVWLERTSDGRVLHADVRGMPVQFEGRMVRLAAVVDAGLRARLQADAGQVRELLAESGQRLSAVLDAIPDLWFIIDAEGRYLEVSNPEHPSLSSSWDAKRGRLLTETLDPAFADQVLALLERAHTTRRAQSQHYDMLTRGGELRSFEARMVPMLHAQSMVLIRDVTEAVQLQLRFQAMADAAPIAIFMTDADGVCTYANAACTALLGFAPNACGPGAWLDAATPACRPRVEALWQGCLSAATPLAMEFQIRAGPGGIERTVSVRTNPIRRADAVASGHVGALFDVTQARELEAAHQAQAVAEEAGRRQSVFMSRVSHELRTPLNAILGFGQLLQKDSAGAAAAGSARAAEYVRHVVVAGHHMLELVDDLLELQRLGLDQDALALEPVDLSLLVEESLVFLTPSAQAAGVELCAQVPSNLRVRSHGRSVRQILLNLCSNGIKYGSRPGEPTRVVVSAKVLDQDEGVELLVADQGPGLTPEQLAQLFKPFERLGQETGVHGGSGLGLVITRQLAQRLGATVSLSSEPGLGSTAILRLPR